MSTKFKYQIERTITFPDTVIVQDDGSMRSFSNSLHQLEGVYYSLNAANEQMKSLVEIEQAYGFQNMKHVINEL